MKIRHERKVSFMHTIRAGQLGAFIDSIPDYAVDQAVIRVAQDAGGGTPLDPGGMVTLTASWDAEAEEPARD